MQCAEREMAVAEFDITRGFDEPKLEQGLRLMEGVIGGRWNPMILFAIEQGARRFSDIRSSIEHISDTELQRKLNALIQNRLVMKSAAEEDARKSEYVLTAYGGEITHTLHHIMDLSIKHQDQEQALTGR